MTNLGRFIAAKVLLTMRQDLNRVDLARVAERRDTVSILLLASTLKTSLLPFLLSSLQN